MSEALKQLVHALRTESPIAFIYITSDASNSSSSSRYSLVNESDLDAQLSHGHHPTYISFQKGTQVYLGTTKTPMKSTRLSDYYTLFVLYYYFDRVLRKKFLKHTHYLTQCREIGLESVSFVDSKQMIALYEGLICTGNAASEEGENIFYSEAEAMLLHTNPLKLQDVLNQFSSAQKRGPLPLEEGEDREINIAKFHKKEGCDEDAEERAFLRNDRGPSTNKSVVGAREKPLHTKTSLYQVPYNTPTKGLGQLIQMLKGVLKQTAAVATPVPALKKSAPSNSSTTKQPIVPTGLLPSSVGSVNLQDPKSLLQHLSAAAASTLPDPSSANATPAASASLTTSVRKASSSVKSGPTSSVRPGHSTHKIPIIIVPSASTSLITLFNVKEFLENQRFISQEEARKVCHNKKENLVVIHRPSKFGASCSGSFYSPPPIYHVIDSVQKLKAEDW